MSNLLDFLMQILVLVGLGITLQILLVILVLLAILLWARVKELWEMWNE